MNSVVVEKEKIVVCCRGRSGLGFSGICIIRQERRRHPLGLVGMALKHLLTATAVFCSFGFGADTPPLGFDPKVYYTMVEVVCSEGYYIQEHEIQTDDGYILRTYRIPNGKRHPKIPPRRNHYRRLHEGYHPDFEECVAESRLQEATGPPVLLAHGLFGSSDFWVIQGPEYDLAYILADQGYDVWFSNIRGNFYSRRHKTLIPAQPKFWDFSFHENGVYDIPSTIDFILESTKYPQIIYVGHSMGTTMFFVMAALKPEYNDKVRVHVAMAPVSQIRRGSFDRTKLTVVLAVFTLMKEYQKMGVYEFLPRTSFTLLLIRTVCAQGSPFQDLCYDTVFSIFGYPSKSVFRKTLTMCLSHSISSVSVKTLLHYDQLLDKPSFTSYDHGPEENVDRYGQPEPLSYDLTKVTVPTALFYSKDDYICRVKDVEHLKTFLPNVVEEFEFTKYNHVDFVWAYSARNRIYAKIVQLLAKFTNHSQGA